MSDSALARVLRMGDDLVARHKAELREMAKKFLGLVETDAKLTLIALADEANTVTNLDQTNLQSHPEGKVFFYIVQNKSAARCLGSIIVDITPARMKGEMEVLVPGGKYDRIPIEQVTMEWLVVALKRASACLETGL